MGRGGSSRSRRPSPVSWTGSWTPTATTTCWRRPQPDPSPSFRDAGPPDPLGPTRHPFAVGASPRGPVLLNGALSHAAGGAGSPAPPPGPLTSMPDSRTPPETDSFPSRHIGPDSAEVTEMLRTVGAPSLQA